MTQPDFRGKTKKDLSAIAHSFGLLTPGDTSRMTKQQLIDFLTRMAEESSMEEGKAEADLVQVADEVQETAPKSPAKKTRAVKAAPEEPEAEAEPAQEDKAEDKPKEKKAKVTSRKTSPRKTGKSADKAR